jgi:hypothetical protein
MLLSVAAREGVLHPLKNLYAQKMTQEKKNTKKYKKLVYQQKFLEILVPFLNITPAPS